MYRGISRPGLLQRYALLVDTPPSESHLCAPQVLIRGSQATIKETQAYLQFGPTPAHTAGDIFEGIWSSGITRHGLSTTTRGLGARFVIAFLAIFQWYKLRRPR